MFCPNCGNKIQDGSNFCPNCGKNLKNVKITVTENKNVEKNTSNTKNITQETQIFKPIKNLDGIDTTNEIADIIKAVDEKISENIHKYETNSFNKEELEKELEQSESEDVKDEKVSSNKTENNSNNQSDLKEENKNKFSLKKLWHDFINEDDDEFSIFSSMENQEENDDDKIELVTSSTSNDSQTVVTTDTMSIPKKVIEEELDKLEAEENNNSVSENDNDKNSSAKNILSTEKKEPVKDDTKDKNIKAEKKNTKNKNNQSSTKLKEPENKLSHKSFTEKVNEELKKLEEEKAKSLKVDKIEDNKKNNNDKNETNKKDKKNNLKSSIKVDPATNQLDSSCNGKICKLINFIKDKLDYINSFTIDKGKNGIILLAILGIILSFIPIIMGARKISVALIFLLILKLVFSIIEFYLPLNIATEKVWVESSNDEVKYFAFINWFISRIFLFVAFILSPWNGFFNFELLPALTPLPIATILLFVIAILVSLAQFWNQLKNDNLINFTAWYLIPFMLIHFLTKLFFVLINFVI